MDDLKNKLTQLGFSQKEASVYLAALQVGIGSANEIAGSAQVNRATTYAVLKTLKEKGLVTELCQDGEFRYSAESPDVIHTLLAMEDRELTMRKQIASPIVNRLHVFFQKNKKKPGIRYVESSHGLRVMQKEYEQIDSDLIQIVGLDTFRELYGDAPGVDHQESLAKQGKKVRSILVTDSDVKFPDSMDIEFITISPSVVSVKGEMSVCGDRVALFSYSDGLVAIDITSATIADMVRSTLELAWNEAKRLGEV